MTIIDTDKFLAYLIFSKHIDSLTCGEIKEAVEMCKVDVLDKIRAEIEQKARPNEIGGRGNGRSIRHGLCMALEIIDKYMAESEE